MGQKCGLYFTCKMFFCCFEIRRKNRFPVCVPFLLNAAKLKTKAGLRHVPAYIKSTPPPPAPSSFWVVPAEAVFQNTTKFLLQLCSPKKNKGFLLHWVSPNIISFNFRAREKNTFSPLRSSISCIQPSSSKLKIFRCNKLSRRNANSPFFLFFFFLHLFFL